MAEPTIRLLERVRAGDAGARSELMTRVYDELRALAGRYLAGERRAHTLQPTALVHEAFVRLAHGAEFPAESRAQFFATAARSMRQVLIDHARARRTAKRDGERVELDEALVSFEDRSLDLLALDAALGELEGAEPRLARLIELRFFAGMESDEIARVEGVSERTVRRDILFARGWLRRRLEGGPDGT
jgi:RNA polymerase sigma factor (TIGR02999 family)